MLTYNSFLSFYSLFVNLMPFPLIISLISCNSFFSLFVSIQDRAGPIIKNHALRSQFLACFSPPYSGTISESQHTYMAQPKSQGKPKKSFGCRRIYGVRLIESQRPDGLFALPVLYALETSCAWVCYRFSGSWSDRFFLGSPTPVIGNVIIVIA